MVRTVYFAALLMTLAGVASAEGDKHGSSGFGWGDSDSGEHGERWGHWGDSDSGDKHGGTVLSAPEMDPASAMAGLTMLVGGAAVLRGRRRKTSKE